MTIKRKSSPQREHSLAELRQINNRTMENHQKLNNIIDLRQQELGKMRDSLYVEVQNFREAHQAELRRSVEVAMDLATRSLPWWKRTVLAISNRTAELIPVITALVKKEAERVKAEVEEINAKEQAEQLAAKKQLEKDQAALAAAVDVNKDAGQTPTVKPVDDGYGGLAKDTGTAPPATDDYEVDDSLLDQSEVAEEIEPLTPVDLDA